MFTKSRLRISYPAWLWIAAFIVFSVFLTLAPSQAQADTIDDVIDQMQAVYDKLELDPAGKSAVDTAKDNISDLRSIDVNSDPWDDVFAILLTDEVKTRLGGEAAAKDTLKDFLCDLADIQYSTDESTLRSRLESFKTDHSSTVRALFGNDFTIDDLYGYLMEAKEEVPGEISEDVDTLIAIARGDYGGIRNRVKVWMKEALREAATGDYSMFLSKLSDIGWSIDKLIEAKDKIGDAVDSGYAGEIALVKAYVRSEMYFIRNGNRWDGDITLNVGNTLPLELSVMGYDWAGDVLDWDTDNHGIATVNNRTLTAVSAGDTTLTAFRPGNAAVWLYRVAVHVNLSGNTNLSGLALSSGSIDPAFSPAVTLYTVIVASDVTGITVTPTAASAGAVVEVNGAAVPNGTASANIPLAVGNNTITVTVRQGGADRTYTLTVIRPRAVTATPASPTVTVTDEPVDITVPAGVSGAKIEANVNANNEATLPLVQAQVATSLGVVAVQIPAGTTVIGSPGWDGTIDLPTVMANDSVSISNGSVTAVVEVGFSDEVLTFDKAVRLLIPEMAGKSAAYKRGNNNPVLITRTISADSQTVADDELPAGGDGKIDVDSDLAIWTKHFTKFVAYTPQSSPGGGGGGGGGTPVVPPPPATDITVTSDGGTFTTADGLAGLIVPEGILTGEATIRIVLTTGPMPDPSMTFASNVYEFTSSAAFNGAVTITLKYDPAKVADPTKLGIYYYNETLGQWVFLGGTVDPVTGTVSVQVDHFTKFAILINPNKVKLPDIDQHWGYRYIDRLVGMGIISGYEDGTFRPDRTISRAEFATIIAKARGLTLDSQAALTFSDAEAVPGWARPAVAAAVQAGIINGYEDNTFRPERQITRAELATMIVRAMNISPAASPALTFSDAGDIPVWARGYVTTAVEKGIIAGRPDNTFGAPDSATRAEAATMVIKMLEALGI